MPLPRQLNPAETAMFHADMERLPTEHRTDIALGWRERCINLMRANANPLADGLAVTEAGVVTMGLGWWDGANEAKRDQLILDWQQVEGPNLGIDTNAVQTPFQDVYDANGKLVHKAVADPRKFWKIPKPLWPTFGFGIMAATGLGGPTYNRFLVAPVMGGVGYVVGSWFRDMAYRTAQAKLAQPVPTEQSSGGEGNPYNGYPRAA